MTDTHPRPTHQLPTTASTFYAEIDTKTAGVAYLTVYELADDIYADDPRGDEIARYTLNTTEPAEAELIANGWKITGAWTFHSSAGRRLPARVTVESLWSMGGREELLAAFTAWADTHPPGTRYRVDEYRDDRVRFSVAIDEDVEAEKYLKEARPND